jgi:hypothetical protein
MRRSPIYFPEANFSFQVLGRVESTKFVPDESYIHISLRDPDLPPVLLPENPNRMGVLFLAFADTDDPYTGITEAQAEEIIRFVTAHRESIKRIVCNCEAGISRSAGVAAALAKWLVGDDAPFFAHFLPNRLVYRRVLNATSSLKIPTIEEIFAQAEGYNCGFSHEEIEQIESSLGLRLPLLYRRFLLMMGKAQALYGLDFQLLTFFFSDTAEILEVQKIPQQCDGFESIQNQPDLFIFADYIGESLYYFICDGADDPIVVHMIENEKPKETGIRFSAFFEKHIGMF